MTDRYDVQSLSDAIDLLALLQTISDGAAATPPTEIPWAGLRLILAQTEDALHAAFGSSSTTAEHEGPHTPGSHLINVDDSLHLIAVLHQLLWQLEVQPERRSDVPWAGIRLVLSQTADILKAYLSHHPASEDRLTHTREIVEPSLAESIERGPREFVEPVIAREPAWSELRADTIPDNPSPSEDVSEQQQARGFFSSFTRARE